MDLFSPENLSILTVIGYKNFEVTFSKRGHSRLKAE